MSNDQRLAGQPFIFEQDTVRERHWRVHDGWLQCENAGGWDGVLTVLDGTDLLTRLAWLSGRPISRRDLDERYGRDRHRNDLTAIKPLLPKWGKRGSPGYYRLPSGSRPTHFSAG